MANAQGHFYQACAKIEKKQSKAPLPKPEQEQLLDSEEELVHLLTQLHIPPGVALNDIFLDAQDMSEQLRFCKRGLNNMRKKGELSYTQLTAKSKVYYLKQEVAATLKKNIVVGKNSPLRRNGPKCINALIGLFSIGSFDAAELVNMLMFA